MVPPLTATPAFLTCCCNFCHLLVIVLLLVAGFGTCGSGAASEANVVGGGCGSESWNDSFSISDEKCCERTVSLGDSDDQLGSILAVLLSLLVVVVVLVASSVMVVDIQSEDVVVKVLNNVVGDTKNSVVVRSC